jgi:two-component system response regulator MtrA
VTKTNPQLVEAFRVSDWEIEAFAPVELVPASPSRLRELHVIVVEATDAILLDKCREICRDRIAPVLAIVANLAFAEAALEAGADDFLVAPVDPIEALLRAHKLARASNVVRVGDLAIDLTARRVRYAGRTIKLSPVEFRLLVCLAKHMGQAVSYDKLLEDVWGCDPESGGTPKLVRNSVARLRKKIEPESNNPHYIISIRKGGYRLRDQAQWEEAVRAF